MIVILGSRHDVVAQALRKRWRRAELCTAEDLLAPGWIWPVRGDSARRQPPLTRQWVIAGRRVPDTRVSGVFVRRSAVYVDELRSVHPVDRAYLAAELHAFVTLVLTTTRARVVNPVGNGGFGEEAVDNFDVLAQARDLGIPIAEVTASSIEPQPSRGPIHKRIQIVDQKVFGARDSALRQAARLLAGRVGLSFATFCFDQAGQLLGVTTQQEPIRGASSALEEVLSGPIAAEHVLLEAKT